MRFDPKTIEAIKAVQAARSYAGDEVPAFKSGLDEMPPTEFGMDALDVLAWEQTFVFINGWLQLYDNLLPFLKEVVRLQEEYEKWPKWKQQLKGRPTVSL